MNRTEKNAEEADEVLLLQLMRLKQYETPEVARMTRNKQNIMRQVREMNASPRKTFGDRLEIKIPWFFAEPKYGIAAVFVAFFALQYVGSTLQNSSRSTGIYTSTASVAALDERISISTNNISYPRLPSNYPLFDQREKSGDIMLVERLESKK